MRRFVLALALVLFAAPAFAQQFTLEQVRGYPYPSDMIAGKSGAAIAWVLN